MGHCSKCKKNEMPGVEYAGNKYCEYHFMELIEKRIRKHLRTKKIIDIKKNYFLIDDGSTEAKLTEYFLNKIFKGYLDIKIGKKQTKYDNYELIMPTNLDEQALIFLDEFLKNKRKKEKSKIMPLEVVLQKEIEIICNILKINFKQRIKTNKLDELEKNYPGTKFSVLQSKMNLENK